MKVKSLSARFSQSSGRNIAALCLIALGMSTAGVLQFLADRNGAAEADPHRSVGI